MKTAAILLDVEKAFDKVWHPGLIFKLIALGIPSQLINIIKSFLLQRSFVIKINDTTSSSKPIEAGVPQGSCLSPHLFALYVNDLPLSPNVNVALFADDTLFYATSSSNKAAIRKLQKQIVKVQPWYDQWRIQINPLKTTAILFSNKCLYNSPKIHIKNTRINWSKSVKYLGVHIDVNLNFSKHITSSINRAKSARFLLYPMLCPKSPLSTRTKLLIYKMYLLPILTYACQAWGTNISQTNIEALETYQAVTLRKITNLPQFVSNHTIRTSTNMPSISDLIAKLTTTLKENIKSSHYTHIQNISKRNGLLNGRRSNRPIQF